MPFVASDLIRVVILVLFPWHHAVRDPALNP